MKAMTSADMSRNVPTLKAMSPAGKDQPSVDQLFPATRTLLFPVGRRVAFTRLEAGRILVEASAGECQAAANFTISDADFVGIFKRG